jgi:hypothetical protein
MTQISQIRRRPKPLTTQADRHHSLPDPNLRHLREDLLDLHAAGIRAQLAAHADES